MWETYRKERPQWILPNMWYSPTSILVSSQGPNDEIYAKISRLNIWSSRFGSLNKGMVQAIFFTKQIQEKKEVALLALAIEYRLMRDTWAIDNNPIPSSCTNWLIDYKKFFQYGWKWPNSPVRSSMFKPHSTTTVYLQWNNYCSILQCQPVLLNSENLSSYSPLPLISMVIKEWGISFHTWD